MNFSNFFFGYCLPCNTVKKIFIFILISSFSLSAEQVSLSGSVFTVKEGFSKEWTVTVPADCTDCRRLVFGKEKFKSVRIAKLFPEKAEAASAEFIFRDLKRQDFTVFTDFEISERKEYENLCIFLERIGIGWEVYLNGHLLRSEISENPDGTVRHRTERFPIIPVPESVLKKGKNILVFRLAGDIRDTYLSLFLNSPEITSAEDAARRQLDLKRSYIHFSYWMMGFLFLVIFFFNTRYRFNFYLASGLLCYAVFRFSDSHFAYEYFGNSLIPLRMTASALSLMSGIMMMYINYLVDEKAHWIVRLTSGAYCVLAVCAFFLPHSFIMPFAFSIGNISIFAFAYLIAYRIIYTAGKKIYLKYKDLREEKTRHPLLNSLSYNWKYSSEFILSVSLLLAYSSLIIDYTDYESYSMHGYSSDFTFAFFYVFMAVFIYKIRSAAEEKRSAEIQKLKYEKERAVLERENAVLVERENIFSDIHDNLGGKLLDLSFMLAGLSEDRPLDAESKKELHSSVLDVQKKLRSRLLEFEDRNTIEKNFSTGLRLFLSRRYFSAERRLNFESETDIEKSPLRTEDLNHFLSIIHELASNDLKYGTGISFWKVHLDQNRMRILLESDTAWETDQEASGKGHSTIKKRAEIIHSEFKEERTSGKYKAELILSILHQSDQNVSFFQSSSKKD